MKDFKDNPLIKSKNIYIIDKPGCDSQTLDKDLKMYETINKLNMQECPVINIYITVPADISR